MSAGLMPPRVHQLEIMKKTATRTNNPRTSNDPTEISLLSDSMFRSLCGSFLRVITSMNGRAFMVPHAHTGQRIRHPVLGWVHRNYDVDRPAAEGANSVLRANDPGPARACLPRARASNSGTKVPTANLRLSP